MKKLTATTGQWYKETLRDMLFQVVALDEKNRTVEVQLIDGEISEYDFESWYEMSLEEAAPPEDWRSPFEIPNDNWQDDIDVFNPEIISNSLNNLEPDSNIDFSDEYY